MEMRTTQVVPCSPEQAFALISDFEQEHRWNDWAKRVQKSTPGPIGKGTVFHGKYKMSGEVDEEVVDFEPAKAFEIRAVTPFGEGRHAFYFEAVPEGTRIVQVGRMNPRGLGRLMMPLMAPLLRRHIERNARGIERALAAR